MPAAQKGSWTSFLKSFVKPLVRVVQCPDVLSSQPRRIHGGFISPDGPSVYPVTHITHGISRCVSWCGIVVVDTDLLVAYWCERPELFAQIADGETEEARALAVLRWFIVILVHVHFVFGAHGDPL